MAEYRRLRVNPTNSIQLVIKNRVRGREPNAFSVDVVSKHETAVKLITLIHKLKSKKRVRLSENDRSFLISTGVLAAEVDLPKEVSSEFLLEGDLLKWLLPDHRDEFNRIDASDLTFDRQNVYLQLRGQEIEAKDRGVPSLQGHSQKLPIVWIWDPGLLMWSYWKVTKAQAQLILGLQKRKMSASSLNLKTAELFFHARILNSSVRVRNSKRIGQSIRQKMRTHLGRESYVVVRNVITPLQLAFFKRYSTGLEAEGYLETDLQQVKGKRSFIHDDVLCQFVHRQSAELIRQLSREPVLPSYSYLSVYKENAELKAHVDREQCAWNGSLLVNESPMVSLDQTWPLFLKTKSGTKEVRLKPGDMVVYRGSRTLHWRNKLTAGRRQSLLLLHYVPLNFTGFLE